MQAATSNPHRMLLLLLRLSRMSICSPACGCLQQACRSLGCCIQHVNYSAKLLHAASLLLHWTPPCESQTSNCVNNNLRSPVIDNVTSEQQHYQQQPQFHRPLQQQHRQSSASGPDPPSVPLGRSWSAIPQYASVASTIASIPAPPSYPPLVAPLGSPSIRPYPSESKRVSSSRICPSTSPPPHNNNKIHTTSPVEYHQHRSLRHTLALVEKYLHLRPSILSKVHNRNLRAAIFQLPDIEVDSAVEFQRWYVLLFGRCPAAATAASAAAGVTAGVAASQFTRHILVAAAYSFLLTT